MGRLRAGCLILLTLLLFACAAPPITAPATGPEPDRRELVVFAAASLTEAFGEIGTLFERQHPGATIIFNFAGSNQLAEQIGQDAPADVFASANRTQMETAIASTRIVRGSEETFVRNRLIVITPAENPGTISTLQDLATPGLKIIFAADAVPVGQYSIQFLDNASGDRAFAPEYKADVLANIVSYEENVRSVLSKVQLGEADAGIVYGSDISPDRASGVAQIEIPDALNVIAAYPIAPLADSPHPELAADFIAFVLSPEGQQILTTYGFISINE